MAPARAGAPGAPGGTNELMTDEAPPYSNVTHRGVRLFAQGPRAMARSRRNVDAVLDMVDLSQLQRVCLDRQWSGE